MGTRRVDFSNAEGVAAVEKAGEVLQIENPATSVQECSCIFNALAWDFVGFNSVAFVKDRALVIERIACNP